jgi:hypothetical protein
MVIMKRRILLLFLGLFLCFTQVDAQVSVTATAGVVGPTAYTNLGAAFTAINAGTHQGAITIDISANTLELAPAVLNSSGSAGGAIYTSVLIRPTVDGVVITGATISGRGLIELKGADNITIDGDNPNTGGINRNLGVVNTAANTTTFTSCIRVATVNSGTAVSADNITIQNLVVVGSATGRNSAATTSTTGSENNTFGIYAGGNGGATDSDAPTAITNVTTNTTPAGTTINTLVVSNCSIIAVARGIAFLGSSAASSTGVSFTNNQIGDQTTVLAGTPPFSSPSTTVYSKGITLQGTTSVSITGNSIKNILSYVAVNINAIELSASIGAGTINISNNSINGLCNNSNNTTAPKAILVSNAGAPYTISGNTISNIQWIGGSTTLAQTLSAIDVNTAAASGTIQLNKITSIYNRNTGTYGVVGINISGGNNVTVQNNFVADVNHDMTGGFAFDFQYGVYGIKVNAGTGHRVYNNSVNLFGSHFGTANSSLVSACLAINGTARTGMDVRNNIFSNTLSGGTTSIAHVSIFLPSGGTSAMNLTLNNNAYYCGSTSASQGIAQVGTTASAANLYLPGNFIPGAVAPATNLRSYTSTLSVAGTNDNASLASTNAAPYVSNTDLHINLGAPNATDVNATAAVIGGLTTDIDGDTRDAVTPDIGADEFILVVCSAANGGTISPTTYTVCQNQTVALSSVGATTGLGISYQWRVSNAPGGPYSNVIGGTGATTANYTTGPLAAGTYYYVMQTTCSFGPLTGLSNEVTVTVNPAPAIAVAPTSGSYCPPGAGVVLTASNGIGYTWGPAGGLSATTGSTVTATPSASTTYTVTGTDALGCTATATTVLTVSETPSMGAVTATPAAVCSGGNSQLQASGALTTAYTVTNIPFAAVATPGSGVTTLSNLGVAVTPLATGTLDDGGWQNQTLPFGIFFFGNYYNSFAISTNGFMYLGAGAPNTFTGYGNAFPSTFAARPSIGAMYSDLDFRTNGTIEYFTVGTAPNRQFVVNWKNGQFYNAVGGLNTQLIIYETTNVIEVHTTSSTGTNTAVEGIQNAAGTLAYTVAGRNNVTWAVATPDGYRWAPSGGPVTYSWSPATFLSNTAIANPMANGVTSTNTYTVTVSNGGCSATGTVTLTAGSPLASTAFTSNSPVCAGSNLVATALPTGGGAPYTYKWDYGTGQFTTPTSTLTINTIPVGSYTLTSIVLDNCGDSTIQSAPITINPVPVVTVTPTSATYCSPGPGVSLTANGGVTYSWLPATGLSATTGSPVDASPAVLTTYTVTGTAANGCTASATTVISSATYPTANATANPTSICINGSSTLVGTGTSGVTPTYCQPTYTNGTGFGDYISSVALNTLNNTSVGAAAPYYTLYPASGSTTTTLVAGNTYNITLSCGTYTLNDIAAFIDYNQNGTLNNPGEKLGETNNLGATPASTTFNFTVPLTALNGPTRLRVREMDYGGTNTMDPCLSQSTFGETEDYTITIVGGVDPVTFSWSPATYLNTTTNDTALATLVPSTMNYVFAVNNSGCITTDTVTLNVDPVLVSLIPVNIQCNGDSSGSFTLGTVTCGTAPFVYSVDGGSFGPIPTNLVAGTHSVIVRDAILEQSAPVTITITQPSWTPDVPTVIPSNVNLCVGDTSAVFTIPSSGSLVIPFDVLTQPTEVNAAPGNVIATAVMPALPGGATITSAVLTYNNITAVGFSWQSDVRLGFNGAVIDPAAQGTGAANATGNFNYTRNIPGASINAAGGSIDLLYWDFFNDNLGDESTFPTGTGVATLTINYSVNGLVSADSVNWYSAAVGGTLLATNDSLEAVGTSVLPNTNTPGTYTFYAEGFYHGCTSDTRTPVTVVVGAYPVVNLGADAAYCNNHILDAGNPGLDFLWNDSTTNQTLNALDTGLYYVTVTSALGCATTDSINLVINPLPTVDLGPDTVSCGSYLLDPGPQPGTSTFLWNDLSTQPTLFTTTSGDYNVTVTDVNGCTNADTVTVNVPPITYTSIGPDTTLCTNDAGFTLDATAPGSNTYVWQDGSTNPTFFVNLPGTYWVTLTNFVGCTYTDTIVVTSVNPVQTNIDVNFITMSSATLDAGSGFNSYLWSTSAGTQVITVTSNGTYFVTVTDQNGCATTDTVTIVFSLGVFNPNGSTTTMSLYPNPSQGVFNLAIDNLETPNLVVDVLDLNGKVVYNRVIGAVAGSVIEPFSLTDLRMGTYILRLNANGKTSQLRFIIGQ